MMMPPAWWVEYEPDGRLVREGPDPITVPGVNNVKTYAVAPTLVDPFSGYRVLQWDAATLDYVAVT